MAMPAAIKPYSMAVAPDSSLQNLTKIFIFLALKFLDRRNLRLRFSSPCLPENTCRCFNPHA
jgi:hypothetical protein